MSKIGIIKNILKIDIKECREAEKDRKKNMKRLVKTLKNQYKMKGEFLIK